MTLHRILLLTVGALTVQGANYCSDFESPAVGSSLPIGWTSEASNTLAIPHWELETDPSGSKMLRLVSAADRSGGFGGFLDHRYNLCWTQAVGFLDGHLSVRFKTLGDEPSRGGGLVWRVKERQHYYMAGYDPLEGEFGLYYVLDGDRTTLATTKLTLDSAQWHRMRIEVNASRITAYVDDIRRLQVDDDRHVAGGGTGVWSKTDAGIAFDDFNVTAW